jgi:hypothetical protein
VTITTLHLVHKYGDTKEFHILRVESEGFVIRWGFQEYTLHVGRNQLVKIKGNRITKAFSWKAQNIEELKTFHYNWVKAKKVVTITTQNT